MGGGKSRETLTVAEVESRLKRVLSENTFDYTHKYFFLCIFVIAVVTFIERRRYEFIPGGILYPVGYTGLLVLCVCAITVLLNIKLLDHIKVRATFLKYRFIWKMVAPFLLLQPRAYPLMIQFLKHVDDDAVADLEKGEEEKDSLV